MGIFSGIGSIIDNIFGSGSSSNSETEQIKSALEADDKRDKTQAILIYLSLGVGFTALMVAIFKKK
jgi:hypothetical protein